MLNGWDVAAFYPDPAAPDRLKVVLANARHSLPALYDRPPPAEGRRSIAPTPAAAAEGASWVQLGDHLDTAPGGSTFAEVAGLSGRGAIIARSNPPAGGADAAGTVIARAFGPVYLVPLVVLAEEHDACGHAADTLRGLGVWPVYGSRGSGLMDKFLESITDGVEAPISRGTPRKEIEGALGTNLGLLLITRGGVVGAALAREPESVPLFLHAARHERDDMVVGILRALRRARQGAGAIIVAHEATLALPTADGLPVTLCREVPETSTDYNGHMCSHHSLETGSLSGDRFLELIGVDAASIARGRSCSSVEDHVRYRAGMRAGDRITVTTQVIGGDGKRVHLLHFIHRGDGILAATMETLLIRTDLTLRRACPPDRAVGRARARWVETHAHLDRPKDAGRAVSRQTG